MFDGIDENRVLNMTDREKRWLDNIKKAFYESDLTLQSGTPEDRCLEELFKAIDTAKTLRRSLRGEDTSHYNNRDRFIEFLGLEIPCARPNSLGFKLRDTESGTLREYTLGEIIYDIRCMIHENENLSAAENVEHHILLDWSVRNPIYHTKVVNGRLICNGFFLWNRLREVLSKFITGVESMISLAKEQSFCITIRPEIGAICPLRAGKKSRPKLKSQT